MTLDEARIHALENTPTVRQLYIAACIQGMLSNPQFMVDDNGHRNNTFDNYAKAAIIQADAIIKREKGWE